MVLILCLPHLCSWLVCPTRCRQPGTVWSPFPGGRSPACSARHRPHQSDCCRRFGRRSHFLEGRAVDSGPLGEEKTRKKRGGGGKKNIVKSWLLYRKHKQTKQCDRWIQSEPAWGRQWLWGLLRKKLMFLIKRTWKRESRKLQAVKHPLSDNGSKRKHFTVHESDD